MQFRTDHFSNICSLKVDRRSLSLTQLSCLFGGRREIQLIMIFLFSSEKEISQEAARPAGNGSPSLGRQWLTFKLHGKQEGHGQHHERHKSSGQYTKSNSHPILPCQSCPACPLLKKQPKRTYTRVVGCIFLTGFLKHNRKKWQLVHGSVRLPAQFIQQLSCLHCVSCTGSPLLGNCGPQSASFSLFTLFFEGPRVSCAQDQLSFHA